MKPKLKIRIPISKMAARRLALGLLGLAVVAVIIMAVGCAGVPKDQVAAIPFQSMDGCQICWLSEAGDWDCDPVDIHSPDCDGGDWD